MDKRIECLFYAKFDNKLGPSMMCQYPDTEIASSLFKEFSKFVITKPYLANKAIMINSDGYKIIGYCRMIVRERYDRNAFIFNVCCIVRESVDSEVYRPIVEKITSALANQEELNGFLSNQNDDSDKVLEILKNLYINLGKSGTCTVNFGGKTRAVKPWDVCVPLVESHRVDINDMGIMRIMRFIDGHSHAKRVAEMADMDLDIALLCMRHLVHFNVVTLVKPFNKHKIYVARRDALVKLRGSAQMYRQCVRYSMEKVGKGNLFNSEEISHSDVVGLYCQFKHGQRFEEYYNKYLIHQPRINPRAFLTFGLIKGLIYCVDEYPLFVTTDSAASELPDETAEKQRVSKELVPSTARLADGTKTMDQIACELDMSYTMLFEICQRIGFILTD